MDPMTSDTAPDPKAQFRAAARAARREITPVARAAAQTRLWALLRGVEGQCIAGYLPLPDELDPTCAMRAWAFRNTVCAPVVTAKGAPLRFRQWWPGCPLVEGAFGVREPQEGGWRVPDVVVVPLLAFDAGCGRLGYGGGFYDRTLAGLPEARTVGLGAEALRVRQVPRERWDVDLDAVVTEAGVHLRAYRD